MAIEVKYAYSASFEEFYAKLTDEAFLRAKYEGIGSRNLSFSQCGEADGVFRIEWTREVPADPPAFARMFLNEWNSLVESMEWTLQDDRSAQADYRCTVSGIPGVLTGWFDLRASGDGCVESIVMEATVQIPLLGSKLAALIEEDCKKQLDKEDAFARHSK